MCLPENATGSDLISLEKQSLSQEVMVLLPCSKALLNLSEDQQDRCRLCDEQLLAKFSNDNSTAQGKWVVLALIAG